MKAVCRWSGVWLLVLLGCGTTLGAMEASALRQVDAEVRQAWQDGADEIRVIVHLQAPSEARLPLSPRGVEYPPARLATVRETTAQVIGELLDAVRGPEDLELHHASPLRPMLAVTVSRDGLTALVEHPAVAWVESDDKVSIQTEQGIDLIGGGLLHDLGVTGEGAAVAIIDSGVDYMHPALGGGEIPNGKVVYGKDTGDNDDDPMDCEGHGTGVAGIAAGLPYEWPDGGESFAGGVAPGASILAYKAMRLLDCSDGSFYASNVIAAIDDAVLQRDAYNVVAINLSLGGGVFSQGPCDTRSPAYFYAIRDAVEAGVAVFAAAGNEARKTHLGAPACISDAISVGSVYDNNTVPFGLDYGVCQDQQLVPKVPTCYSNSSPYLDLLAPAEPLESVAWDGRVTSFGGTSGATPYATGAAALLAEIANGEGVGPLAPSALRSALKVSGEPVTDPANGGVTSLIELVAAAGVVADSVASMPETVEIPNDGAPVVATTVVDQPGLVRSLRVAVDLVHRKPSELVVTLTAPDGAQLVLHDHGAGSTEDEATAISGHDGLSVVYPDDRQPAEPLDQLNGVVAAGPWTLEIIDDDPTQQYSGVSPRFLGWALDLETETGPETTANDAFVVPVAAHASGANDTFWVTDVRLLNPQFGNPVPVRVFFVPQEEDGSRVFDSVSVEVPGNTVVSLPDILASKLNLDSAQGNLLFQPQGPGRLLATSRTYNTGGDAGTFGQFIGPESAGAAIGAGDPPLWLAQLASTSGFHTNIGLTELAGQEAQVAVRLFDGDTGSQLAEPLTVDVPPFSNVQRNFVFAENDVGGSANAFATVEVVGGAGRVVAYGSVVDDATGDAIAIRGQHAPQASNQMVPIVAKVPGANSTSWVSDVRVLNTTSVVVPLQVVLTTAGGDEASIERSVAAGTSLALDDVVGDAFGRDSGSGSLRVIGRDGETGLIVTSRTYNLAASGTFGQFIPAVIEGFSADDGPVLMHLDASEAFRTNIGVCEVAGGTATVRYVLKNAAGSTLGIGDLEVGPYEVVQVNDVFAEVGAAAEGNARVDLFVEGGDGAITAYGSVVDNISGDAIFVPAANLQTD